MTPAQFHEQPRAIPVDRGQHLRRRWLLCVALCLSLFVLRTYIGVYDPQFGWSKLIVFGAEFGKVALPRLQRIPHYVDPSQPARFGYDGQFYAQMALEPSLRDPAFDRALDNPTYRGRRIGLPALAFCLGGGQPSRVIQAYAVANLIFWFALLGALAKLFSPWTGQQLLCLSAGLLSYGVLVSMKDALTDLPAGAMIFAGIALGSRARYGAFAAAVLTRETTFLAAIGCLDLRRPWQAAVWKRNLGLLALAAVPFIFWLLYLHQRFPGVASAGFAGNFALPLQAMGVHFSETAQQCVHQGLGRNARMFRWLYVDHRVHQLLTITAICVQGLFFALRRDWHSAFWRTGVCYLALCSVLGPAVWEDTGAAARVLIPMTICFYLLLARERAACFWPFFLLGSLSIPYGLHEFWKLA